MVHPRRSAWFWCVLSVSMLFVATSSANAQYFTGLPNSGCGESRGAGLALLAGYCTNLGMNKFGLDAHGAGIGGVGARLHDYQPTSALYLASELPIDLGRMGKALISGSVTLPATRPLYENDFLFPSGPAFGGSSWSADTIWFTVQGLYGYPMSGLSFLAGFRWDHWQTSLKGRSDISPGFAVASPNDTGALTLNGFIPLIGTMASYGGATVGVIGFPLYPGDFEYEEVRNLVGPRYDSGRAKLEKGYFLEVFGEYGVPMGGGSSFPAAGTLAVFGKIHWVEAKQGNFTFTRATSGATDEFNFWFGRTLLVVGAKANLDFNIPSVRGWF